MRHAVLALTLAISGCSSCRDDKRAPSVPPPATDAATLPSAPSPSASAAASAETDAAAPSADAPWELVAKRNSSDRPLWVAELGKRVVIGDRSPLAWADGAGPLVAAPHVEAEWVVGLAGTHPSAAFLATDKRVHQLVADGWRDLGALPPRTRGIFTWGDRSAVVVASVIEHNSMPSIHLDEGPATTLRAFSADGEAPPVLDLERGFGTSVASGTRDGHLWLLGFRATKNGLWLAHVQAGKKTGYQLFPGSEKCDAAGFGIYVYRSHIVGTSGERAFLLVANDAAECLGPMGAWLYERSEKGFGNIPLPKKDIDSLGTEIIGSALDGTIYVHVPMPESVLYRRDASGKMTKVTMPKSCVPTRIVVRDDGDTWMTARCDGHDGVYRRGRPQAPLAL